MRKRSSRFQRFPRAGIRVEVGRLLTSTLDLRPVASLERLAWVLRQLDAELAAAEWLSVAVSRSSSAGLVGSSNRGRLRLQPCAGIVLFNHQTERRLHL